MANNVHVVFNHPPSGVSDDEFNEWAIRHFAEILVVPGWETARRFRLDPVFSFPSGHEYRGPDLSALNMFRFMSLYEIGGDAETAIDELRKEVASGRMDFPDWFERAEQEGCFLSWNAVPINVERSS